MLEELGGTPLEDKVYRYLVGVPSATGAAVTDAAAAPRRAVIAALAALESRGLVTRATGRPTRYLAAPPNVAGQALLLQQRQALVRAEADLLELAKAYRHGSALRSVTEVVEVLLDPSALRGRLEWMMRDARKEFLALVAPGFKVIPVDEAGSVQVHVAGANRTVFDRRILETPGIREAMRASMHQDEEWRVHPQVPMKFVIVDREVAVLTAVYAETGPPATMLVHRSTLLDALVGYFQLIWSQAIPLPAGPRQAQPDDSILSTEDKLLTSLLLAGLTDQAIATHLGAGHRSVQRRVRQLMDLAEVDTRVQLGWHAHKYGWLADGDDAPVGADNPTPVTLSGSRSRPRP